MTTVTIADAIWFIDNLARASASAADRFGGSRLAVVESEGRRGDMPPLHVHRRDDEAFYVLEGEMLAAPAAGRSLTSSARAQAACRVEGRPARLPRRVGDRALARRSPRLPASTTFVREVGEPTPEDGAAARGETSTIRPRLAEIAARFGIELLGPPGTLP